MNSAGSRQNPENVCCPEQLVLVCRTLWVRRFSDTRPWGCLSMRTARDLSRYALLFLVAFFPVRHARAADPTLSLQAGPPLLLDEFLIEKSEPLIRTLNPLRRDLAGPVVTAPEDRNWQPYCTVLRDGKTGLYRIWYDVP